VHGVAPPHIETLPFELVDACARRSRRDGEADRHGLVLGAARPFGGNVRLQSSLYPPPRGQYEHHRENGGDDERSSHRALLPNRGGDRVFDHEFVPPFEFIVHRFGEQVTSNDERPQRHEGVESRALRDDGRKILHDRRRVAGDGGFAAIDEFGQARRRGVQRPDRLGAQGARVDGVRRAVREGLVIGASLGRQDSERARMFERGGSAGVGGHLHEQYDGDRQRDREELECDEFIRSAFHSGSINTCRSR